jgi:hypothetical protein
MTATRQRRPLILIGVVCAAFLAGMVARGLLAGAVTPSVEHSVDSNAGADLSARGSPGPARYSNGIPEGFARSPDGARAAAAAYVLTGQVLIDLPPTAVDEAVRAMSSAGSADVQVSTTEQQLDQLRAVLAPGTGLTRYLQAVIATRVDAFAPDRARVSVWNVGVLSRMGVAAPQAGWTTSTFDLVWERGDWKVWGESIAPGPAPALNGGVAPATSVELDAKLDGFTPWEPSP